MRRIWLLLAIGLSLPAFAWDESPRVRPDDPLVRGALDRIVPDDPLDLLGAQKQLAALNFKKEADAVSSVAERAVLLQILGQPFQSGQPLETAMQEEPRQRPKLTDLRARVLSKAIKLEIPQLDLARAPIVRDAQVSDRDGGEWTTALSVDRHDYVRIPISAKYLGARGWLAETEIDIRIVPLKGGERIEGRMLIGGRNRPGVEFWPGVRVGRVPVAAVAQALQGLRDNTYRLETEVISLGVSPAEDETKPYLLVFCCNADSSWVDSRGTIAKPQLPAPKPDPLDGFAQEIRQKQWRAQPAATIGDLDRESRLADPDSPLVRGILEKKASPATPRPLLEAWALLSELGFRNEAQRLMNYMEKATLLDILHRPLPEASVAEILKRDIDDADTRQRLGALVLARALEARIAQADDRAAPKGFEFEGYKHEGGLIWSRQWGDVPYLFVPVLGRNTAGASYLNVTAKLRLVPLQQGREIVLTAERNSGTIGKAGDPFRLYAHVPTGPGGCTVAELVDALRGLESGRYRLETMATAVAFEFAFVDGARFHLSSAGGQWSGLDPFVRKAHEVIAAADCKQRGACLAPRSGVGASSYQFWLAAVLVTALVPFAVFRGQSVWRGFRVLYALYWILALSAAGLTIMDPPTGHGWDGMMSGMATFLLGMPWPFVLYDLQHQNHGLLSDLIDTYFDKNASAVIHMWLGITINLVLLGLLAFRTRKPWNSDHSGIVP